ncbi:MAG TPA: translation initiation factor IF-2 [Candidatus Pullilachnospira intestinigallinarum]|nr:translation initiation factor IF-2 [Candidatus Pullilachnospira intestinigallinarum]
MSKLRIYEIAQELHKTNKEVLDYLKEKNIEVKSHMSTLEEKDEKMVREAFASKKEENAAARPSERPKKKSNLIQVFRPQNAMTQEGKNFRRPQKGQRPAQGQGRPQSAAKGEAASGKNQEGAAPEVKAQNSQTRRPQGGQNERNQGGAQQRQNRPEGNRRFGDRQGQENRRNDSQRRADGDRNQNGRRGDQNRSGGQRQGRPDGNRRFGDRNGEGRRFDSDKGGMNRDGRDRDGRERDSRRTSDRRDNRSSSMETMDLGLKKPARDGRSREKDKEKEREREEKKTQDRRGGQGGNRPNQGRRPNQRLPKALQKPARPQPKEEKKEEIKEIMLPEKMTIRELAEKMKMQPSVIIKKLFMQGVMATVNQEIDFEKAQEIALEFNIIAEQEEKVDVIAELLKEEEEDPSTLVPRPPVVCVMGHVDHGKTSLLDAIRKTNVTDKEAGGITQHIGAYVVSIKGQKITFLDTPGHEAFTAMRMRGANATDIAVLVVAADDGVMPQTVEAINHAKAANVEIIVAINKIDKPGANIDRVKQELSEYELIPEDWGGSTVFVPVSAKTHEGIGDLLEMILLTAEVAELKANPNRRARGLVIEAQLDKGKGPVATILIQKGTLHVGDFIAAGASSGKVRAMMDDKGRRVKEAGPSTPVEILGLSDVPNAGEILVATENDKEAKHFAATFISENKNRLLEETKTKMSLDDLFNQIQEGNLKELNIVVKADVQGSVEAVKQSLVKLSNEEVVVKIIHGGVGAINESDVTLASASNAIIIGFNVRPDATAKAIAEQEGVDLRLYRVIYQAIEDVEAAMKGMLDPVFEEKVIGHAEVRQTFKASGVGTIAGCYVLDGVFQRGCSARITREGAQIFDGPLASLKRFKDDVKEVKAGYECGLVFEGFNDIQELDQVEAYTMVEVPR